MTNDEKLDLRALDSAKHYMGALAWPSIALGLAVGGSYIATVAMTLIGVMPPLLAIPLAAVLTYLSYTVLHEAAHGSISGSHTSRRWINEALGYMAAWILMIPLTAHRHEHLAHHRHTNDEHGDPDFGVEKMRNSLPSAAGSAIEVYFGQFSYYTKKRWPKAPTKQNLYFCLEIAVALIPRLALLATGYWAEALYLFVLAWLVGLTVVLYLFAYIVHRPHKQVGRYVDTSTILVPGPLNRLLTWGWMFQNYHSIHHLFPRVPFYQYANLYTDIQDIMAAKGSPVYHLTGAGLSPRYVQSPA